MRRSIGDELNRLFSNYPELSILKESMLAAFKLMRNCYLGGGLIMVCGNGGSAADACHIVGELMKGFKLKRTLKEEQRLVLEKTSRAWVAGLPIRFSKPFLRFH